MLKISFAKISNLTLKFSINEVVKLDNYDVRYIFNFLVPLNRDDCSHYNILQNL